MLKFYSIFKIFGIIFLGWLIASFSFGKFEASSDGYNEIGFPFTFYRSFSGKCFDCKETGFLLEWFLLDSLIILIFAFLLRIIIYKVKAAH